MAGLVVVAVGSRRRPMAHTTPPTPAAAREMVSLAKVAEMGLAAMIAPGQDPRTAIIACYVAMERGLAQAREVAPLVSDTPSEVLARAFERGVLHDASARELVALFEEARFSPHSMLEWQRMRAEQLLRIVLQDLQGQKYENSCCTTCLDGGPDMNRTTVVIGALLLVALFEVLVSAISGKPC